jgi:D-3-phosphoglycerate dehydrogenase
MIGLVASALGGASINISDMRVGRSPTGEAALMVLSTDQPVGRNVIDALRAADGVLSVHTISGDA